MNSPLKDNSHYKILIIEDELDIRELIRLQLQLQNYQVMIAETGEKAKELLSENDFDLVLLDRMLPDCSGLEICKEIRAQNKTQTTPIVLVTALSEPQNIIEGLDAGADDYITKPFDINVLHARVRAQLRRVSPPQDNDILSFSPLSIDIKKCRVKLGEQN